MSNGTTPSGSDPVNTGRYEQPEQNDAVGILKRQWHVLLIIVLLIALGALYLWKNNAVNSTREEVKAQAARVIAERNAELLRLVSVPLVWAVRGEMMRGNYDQINQYLINFVREPHVQDVILAKTDGMILLATNKRLEGKPVTDSLPASVLQVEKTTVSSLEGRGLMSASPVMGLNRKLGVLIVVYAAPKSTLESSTGE